MLFKEPIDPLHILLIPIHTYKKCSIKLFIPVYIYERVFKKNKKKTSFHLAEKRKSVAA